jgi:4-hydroxybenzoate polyprenyltransferase
MNLPFLFLAPYLDLRAAIALCLFLFFSVFYSASPIRAKTKPILDSAFNVLYIFPGIFSYALLTGVWPPLSLIIAGWLWTMAMHAFSAVPDISADLEADISTVATLLRRHGTIFFCSALYLAAAFLSFPYLGVLAVILGGAYLSMMAVSILQRGEASVFSVYKWFPIVNSVAGLAIFWNVFLPKVV